MIYDTQEQKDFIFKILRSYSCPYSESLNISQTHAISIQSGVVVPLEEQQKLVDKLSESQKELTPDPPGKNGNKKKKGKEQVH